MNWQTAPLFTEDSGVSRVLEAGLGPLIAGIPPFGVLGRVSATWRLMPSRVAGQKEKNRNDNQIRWNGGFVSQVLLQNGGGRKRDGGVARGH